MKCNVCGKETNGTWLQEQHSATPEDPVGFLAPLCKRKECRDAARKVGAKFI